MLATLTNAFNVIFKLSQLCVLTNVHCHHKNPSLIYVRCNFVRSLPVILFSTLDGSMSTLANDNLARIRHNQRRSRARRREYLLELEQRVGAHELQGIEASCDIQRAARRVSEENHQLRCLLTWHGISDDGISSYLHSAAEAPSDPTSTLRFTRSPDEAARSLQRDLALRTSAPLPTVVSGVASP
ncbi:hypothetical protein MRS44_018245 [Fusarium solani]|uniref:uncharacterized protein n=1 Tax=Fusarium solani TaxID=169388 RepID=UPI0032C43CB4|nr:hypothetical protein MRS44_018245 [Fusarium solani]